MPNTNPQPSTPPPVERSSFRWLATGAEAFEMMLAAIGDAQVSIKLEMYIFTPGRLGTRFRTALVEARNRGVRVQVLIDAFGSLGLPSNFWTPLTDVGGEFRWFNGLRAALRYGRRNHRKLLVIDGQRAFIGGFNVSEEYHGDGVNKGWRDLGLDIHGPLAAALEKSFAQLFDEKTHPLLSRFSPDTTVQGDNWTLLLSKPGWGHRAFKGAIIKELSSARDVRIVCAYFVPTWRLRRALMKVARRGGRVQLVLAGRSDLELARLASHSLYSKFLDAGVEIYEYQPQILHAKLFLIDQAVYAGSANLDTRSLNINHELSVRIADPKIAAEAGILIEGDLTHCRRVDPQTWRASRSFLIKLLEHAAYFLMVRIDPHITSLRWRRRARKALEKRARRNAKKAGDG
jgi:cardiolipin synthase